MDVLPDAASRVPGLTEEKTFESSATDEGFISEEISEELFSSKSVGPCDSGIIEPISKQEVAQELESMKVDSGIVDSFSSMSLKNSGLNDLNSPHNTKIINTSPVEPVVPKKTEQAPIYFQQDEDGDTYLHIAILKEFPEVALALIRSAPHPKYLDTRNDDAQSPLHLAVLTGQSRIVRWLIVSGASPNPRNLSGDSPLHIAASRGDVACCGAITDPVTPQERDTLALSYPVHAYEHCELDQWNYYGQTCVHVAALNGHIQVLQHLVWNGADINSREGTGGYTALHIAIERGDENLAGFLLSHCKSLNPNTLTYGKKSPLQLGCTVTPALFEALKQCGVESYYSDSEDDYYDDSTDEEEMPYDTTNMYMPKLVNASA